MLCHQYCFVDSESAPWHVSICKVRQAQVCESKQKLLTPLVGTTSVHCYGIGYKKLHGKQFTDSLWLTKCRVVPRIKVSVSFVEAAKRDRYDVKYDGDTCSVWKDGSIFYTTIKVFNYLNLKYNHKCMNPRRKELNRLIKVVYFNKNQTLIIQKKDIRDAHSQNVVCMEEEP